MDSADGIAVDRHSFFPFFPGISERTWTDDQLANIDPPPFTYQGRTYTYYEATQRQRAMETSIRQSKRETIGYNATGDKQAFQNASIKLQRQKQAYREFSNAAGLRYRLERAQLYGFGQSVAQKVRWSAQRYHTNWLKSMGAESTSLKTLSQYYRAKRINSKEYVGYTIICDTTGKNK